MANDPFCVRTTGMNPKSEIAPPTVPDYRTKCQESWSWNFTYMRARRCFRQWKVTYNSEGCATHCSFQVRKDGAVYNNIPLPLQDNILPTLRLFATIFNLPYRHNLKREELLDILEPVLYRLSYPQKYPPW